MAKPKSLTVNLKRVIAAAPAKVCDAWMDPKLACNPWNHGKKKLIFNPKVDGLFYVLMPYGPGAPHFGRFTKLAKASQVQYTWMSPSTHGAETLVTVNFKKQGAGTLMTLKHTGLTDDPAGRGHQDGWGFFMGQLEERFAAKQGGKP